MAISGSPKMLAGDIAKGCHHYHGVKYQAVYAF